MLILKSFQKLWLKIELRCFWKDIAENYLDMDNFRPDARQPELESQQI
jgi:hypothetical protein